MTKQGIGCRVYTFNQIHLNECVVIVPVEGEKQWACLYVWLSVWNNMTETFGIESHIKVEEWL